MRCAVTVLLDLGNKTSLLRKDQDLYMMKLDLQVTFPVLSISSTTPLQPVFWVSSLFKRPELPLKGGAGDVSSSAL